MKIGQLVMLIKTDGNLPPVGVTGEIHSECCCSGNTRVMFAHHKEALRLFGDGAFCVKKAWLVPIDDADGDIAKEDQKELDFSPKVKERIADLTKRRDDALRELEKVK